MQLTHREKPKHVNIIMEGNKVAYEMGGKRHGPFTTFAEAVHSMAKELKSKNRKSRTH